MPQAETTQSGFKTTETKHHSIPKCHIIAHRAWTEANETGRQERDSPWRETIFAAASESKNNKEQRRINE